MPDLQTATIDNRRLKIAGLVGVAVIALALGVGTVTRLKARSELTDWTTAQAVPSVNIVHPSGGSDGQLLLPGRLRAWQEAPVYARTSGYLKRWYADIGSRVRTGQLLAEIDAPDVDLQLDAAKAALATAEAQRALSATTAARWDRLVSEDAVSKQEADERRGDLAARNAMRNEASANVGRLRTLAGFKRILAPFDGVVTSRSTDVGALIVAGNAQSIPLFTVSDTTRMRIYVSVPQSYASVIRPGLTATFTVPEYPDRTFKAELARSADAVASASGAILIQLVVDNRDGALKPGGYSQVSLDLPKGAGGVRVPATALIFRADRTALATLGPDNKVVIKPVKLGRDFGTDIEIASGISASDKVIDSPSDAIAQGDKVQVAAAKPKGPANARP
jgi:RND family efflux transporter MFP subunit